MDSIRLSGSCSTTLAVMLDNCDDQGEVSDDGKDSDKHLDDTIHLQGDTVYRMQWILVLNTI